jgi:UDP-glucose:(heptosyl)LPS alpha-1,3-glucosyltransferase
MRIALLHPRAASLGGVERQIHDLGVRLADAGHEVHWLCATRAPEVDARLRCHALAGPRALPGAARVWLFDRRARRALAALGPFDVVHGFGKTSRQDVYRDGSGCLADFEASARAPGGCFVRGPQARVVARIERARYAPGGCRVVLAISALVREQILRRYALEPARVRVLHPAVDLARFRPDAAARAALRARLGLAEATPLVAFVGNDRRRKGLATLLAALARLPDAHALVLGRAGAARERRARARAQALGVASRVHWLGLRPDPERVLPAADCLAFPSRFDAFGNAVLEAMACGLPVAVSRRAGSAEVVIPGKTGALLDDPDDAPALAAALRGLLEPGLRAEAGRLAREAAAPHGWERQLERVLEVYREVVEEKRRAAALTRSAAAGSR